MTHPPAIPAKWLRLLRRIPGYDPVSTAGDCRFRPIIAQRAVDFFAECLRHVKGDLAGRPFLLRPWEAAVIANTFGWLRPDGSRRYRRVFLYLPRKNGKTTLTAGIVLLVLFTDGEPGAEIYSAAGDREQAALVFAHAKGMVEQEPELAGRATIYGGQGGQARSIVLNGTASSYKPISADAAGKHGYNVHCAVIDELHVQPNRDLVDALETGTGARRQPLIVYITTADFDRPSICNETLDYAKKVRDGVLVDPAFLPVIYETEQRAEDAGVGKKSRTIYEVRTNHGSSIQTTDWHSPKLWRAVNPNLGVSISLSVFKEAHQKACEQPSFENPFKRLYLNMKTTVDVRWLDLARWDACADPVDEAALVGRPCYSGIDLATTTDIAAHVLAFPPTPQDALWRIVPRFWVPADNAHVRERRDRVPYVAWSRAGHVRLTPGNVIDYETIKCDVEADYAKFSIRETAADRWNLEYIRQRLSAEGIQLIAFGQGFASMSAPTKELEKLVLGRQVAHGGNPVLRWMASNAVVETDAAGNIKPTKERSTEKIDGIVALIMAVGRAILKADAGKRSVYEDRGLRSV